MTTSEHPELALLRKPRHIDVSADLIERQASLLGAINLCIQLSGLDDKELYMTLGIDAGHWSRIMKGDAHFPVNKLDELMTLCGNESPLRWMAHKRGYGLHLLKTEAERRIEELESQLARETERRAWAEEMITRRA